MERTENVTKYYTCLELMKSKFDKYARKDKLKATNIDEYLIWKQQARTKLQELLGHDKMEMPNLSCEILDEIMLEDGIRREKRLLQTEPGVFMPFYVLYPEKAKMRYVKNEHQNKPACMIALPGHSGGGKESLAGRSEIKAIADAILKFNYDYGLELAKQGFITMIPDVRGFGERRELAFQKNEESAYIGGTCYHLAHMAEPLGMTVIGMLTWDIFRLIDWIEQTNAWDMTELGCVGFSGGGMQTLMTAALDDRIKQCIISGYMYGYKDSLLVLNGNCNCNYVPHLWEHFDMGDIGALLAPRKVCIQSCEGDHLNGARGLFNVNEQVNIMRQAYQLYNATDQLIQDIREGGHCFHKEVFSKFFK